MYDEYEQKVKNYSKRRERVVYTEVMLPDNAPREFMSREKLWNSVEMNEKHKSAQYARRFVITLPRELSFEQNLALARQYCQEQFVSQGMCVDFAFHEDEKGNPHFHVLTTMRSLDEQGKWLPKCKKEYILDENGQRIKLPSGEWKSRKVNTNDWNNLGNCEMWRHNWEVLQNSYLEKAGRPERVDMRSFERQQNGLIPTVHLGPAASALESRGVHTTLGDLNREIRQRNKLIISVREGIKKMFAWVHEWLAARKANSAGPLPEIPTIHELFCDYIDQRREERSDWNSMAKLKGLSKDLMTVQDLSAWLDEHNIGDINALLKRLEYLEAKHKDAQAVLQQNDKRRKTIAKIEDAAETIIATKPLHDKYYSIFFKSAKEKFASQHEDELKANKKAYAILMKHNGGKLEVTPGQFDEELTRMETQDKAIQGDLEKMKAELGTLRKVKYYISKVDPLLVGERVSIYEQIPQIQQQIDQRQEELHNQDKRNKEGQER